MVISVHHPGVRSVVVSSSALSRACFGRSLELSGQTIEEPNSLPNGKLVGLTVCEAHVVHQREYLLEKDLLIIRCQAKKSWRPSAGAPPKSLRS